MTPDLITLSTNPLGIPLTHLEVGERFRKDYGDIPQLAYSIKQRGLISPIAIGVSSKLKMKLETDRPFKLLAGGRRLKALESLGVDIIPWDYIRIYDQPLSELDMRSIELAENFDRKDMTYVEEVALKREINTLQIQIHGEKIGRAANSPGWSQADTARLLKESAATTALDLKLADAIEKFPELQLDKCNSKSEAMKRLKKVGKTIVNSQEAQAYEQKVGNKDAAFTKLSSSYIVKDCFEVMKNLSDSSIGFIEIDPPYGIDLHKVKKDNECFGYNEVDANNYFDFMTKVITESYRVLKPDSWLICWFAADPWFEMIANILRDAGFKLNLIPGIWAKSQGQTVQPETFLANSYEMFFYARKGQPKIQRPGRSNIFQFQTVPHNKKYHPTQRPIELMLDLYATFVAPGTVGFIPFLGSGVGILAGHRLKINMVGTDLTQDFKDGYILQLKELLGG